MTARKLATAIRRAGAARCPAWVAAVGTLAGAAAATVLFARRSRRRAALGETRDTEREPSGERTAWSRGMEMPPGMVMEDRTGPV